MSPGRVVLIALLLTTCGTEYGVGDSGGGQSSGTDGGCVDCEKDQCVDLSSSSDHCGACGMACGDNETCVSSECVPECPECDGGEVCEAGECVCAPGLMDCDGSCVDLQANADHCGACNTKCDDACGGGTCQSADCPGFPDACDGACTDTQTDPLNCGECGDACASGESCVDGTCGG